MSSIESMLLAGVLAGSVFLSETRAQTATPAKQAAVVFAPSRSQPVMVPRRAAAYYGLFWGVDALSVKAVESGELIRFSYHVLDADKARPLNDKKNEPELIAPQAGVKLVIPSLEKVGQLRQSSTPESGKSYWMAFSNPGRTVKRGDRVNLVIGQFRAEGLVVE